ncbi:FHA domain-containing protein [Streptomyces tricolor]|nr:FHA domain-containing protein [Streptomyces tricolor]
MPSAPPPGARPGGYGYPAARHATARRGPDERRAPATGSEINGTVPDLPPDAGAGPQHRHADVRIDDPGVSRRHCEIRTGTPSTIQDLGSTNGIVVDGQHYHRATLRDGSPDRRGQYHRYL